MTFILRYKQQFKILNKLVEIKDDIVSCLRRVNCNFQIMIKVQNIFKWVNSKFLLMKLRLVFWLYGQVVMTLPCHGRSASSILARVVY